MSLAIVSRRVLVISSQQSRLLSSQTTVAIEKLKHVLEDYRQQNYTQELPTRFKKELLQAACRTSSSSNNKMNTDRIVQEGMQRVLANIGASDRVSAAEIKSIFDELGNEKGEIVSQKLMQIL